MNKEIRKGVLESPSSAFMIKSCFEILHSTRPLLDEAVSSSGLSFVLLGSRPRRNTGSLGTLTWSKYGQTTYLWGRAALKMGIVAMLGTGW